MTEAQVGTMDIYIREYTSDSEGSEKMRAEPRHNIVSTQLAKLLLIVGITLIAYGVFDM